MASTASSGRRRYFRRIGSHSNIPKDKPKDIMKKRTANIVTVLVALLAAGGGFVAWWEYFSPIRFGLLATAEAESHYVVTNQRGSHMYIVPNEELHSVLERDPTSASAVASIIFDLTNLGPRSFSAHNMIFAFDEILADRRLVIVLTGAPLTERELRSSGFDARVVQSEGIVLILDVRGDEPIETTISRIKESFPGRIEEIVVDAPGDTHSSKFPPTEYVTFLISPDKKDYSARVGYQVTPHDAVQVQIRFGAPYPVRGTGRILLQYNAKNPKVLVDDFRIEIMPAPSAELVAEQRSR